MGGLAPSACVNLALHHEWADMAGVKEEPALMISVVLISVGGVDAVDPPLMLAIDEVAELLGVIGVVGQ
jgi:hypothetical protein